MYFPETEGLRPSTDRIRETVFNWLQPHLPGARCLDLFAGSGVFAFEALSRGAAEVVLVDRNPRVVAALREQQQMLGTAAADIVLADALMYIAQAPRHAFDIVFVDPPFREGLIEPCADLLERNGWLTDPAYVYLEAEASVTPRAPATWELLRSKTAGQVGYHLARRRAGTADSGQ